MKVQFIDDTLGWAVGEYGTMLHTSNGGTSWYEQEYGRTDNMLSISMTSDTVGWAVGDNGTILHTIDSGDDWTEQTSGTTSGLNAVTFLDNLNGWAAGDNERILHTTNGGLTWSVQHQLFANPATINAIAFIDYNRGWAVGSNRTVFHTTDGGTNWITQTVGITLSSYLTLFFADTSLGFIAGTNGVILRTDNGGTTWSAITSGVSSNLNQIIMQNTFVGWIAGDAGTFLKTVNGGVSWSHFTIGDGSDLSGLAKVSGKLWAVGEFGKILLSTNSGVAWNQLDSGPRLSANWIDFPTDSTGVAVGQTGLILRTTNAGLSWLQQSSPAASTSCYGVKFGDSNHGWAVGDNGTILRTTDGNVWTSQQSPVSHALLGITFSDPYNGWIVGGEFTNFTGVILHTATGGDFWLTQYNNVPHILYGVSFPTVSTGWAVGEAGLILHTTNYGNSWQTQTSGVSNALFWCSFADEQHGWAVGESGVIIHTTNGGTTWSSQNSGVSSNLYSVAAREPSEALVAGDEGTILRTTDSGSHWGSPEYSRTPYSLFGIASLLSSDVWVCGDYGTVLKNIIPHKSVKNVSGLVFNDSNNNGLLDPGEPGMQGWKIKLGGGRIDSILTGIDGSFGFYGVAGGSYTLIQTPRPGWIQSVPALPDTYSFSISSGTPSFVGNFGNYAIHTYPYDVNYRWNIVSLPLNANDMRTSSVFPTANSPAYEFNGSYVAKDTLRHGAGYWLKFPADQTVWIAGEPISSDIVPVQQGWNLIGSINDTIASGSVSSNPAGIIGSDFFDYENGYSASTNILPGKGYWVKTDQAGEIILSTSAATNPTIRKSFGLSGKTSSLNCINISDHDQGFQSLFFGETIDIKNPPASFELPPLPPHGAFDARFDNGSMLALFDPKQDPKKNAIIHIQSSHYPVTISWHIHQSENIHYSIIEATTGVEIIKMVGDSGKVSIQNPSKTMFSLTTQGGVQPSTLPHEFELMQNVPNPFNPATTIQFALPLPSKVRLEVFTLLGQEVAKLVDGDLDAGVHYVQWSPSVASGLYFYRLDAYSTNGERRHFTQTRKMMVLK